jgi:hypothetical protein
MVKKLINILLILTLAVTVLPIKQVGMLLSSNQLTEEISEHGGDQPEKKQTNYNPVYCFFGGHSTASSYYFLNHLPFARYSSNLPIHPDGEILVPPPNNIAFHS